ncbi:GNAT family N-acetyltransferase [Peterkaempfera griseoplana]|uniref:GNAT family N-acetyltransferase n=1 Tax=Peterkaempfera griseoplana TaxID=66896 RepID=UPI0006E3EC97|nr:N-acetyltransferase [Peterkaempfera griseoplana]
MSADHAVTVRPGTATDIEEGLTTLSAAEARRIGRASGDEASRDRMRRRLAGPDTFFFVAEHATGGPIGLAAGMNGRRDGGTGPAIPGLCHITMVAVRPERWGEGVGGRLLRAVLSHGRALGYDRFQLFTHADNVRAQRLYESAGFRLTGGTAVSDDGGSIVHYLWAPE